MPHSPRTQLKSGNLSHAPERITLIRNSDPAIWNRASPRPLTTYLYSCSSPGLGSGELAAEGVEGDGDPALGGSLPQDVPVLVVDGLNHWGDEYLSAAEAQLGGLSKLVGSGLGVSVGETGEGVHTGRVLADEFGDPLVIDLVRWLPGRPRPQRRGRGARPLLSPGCRTSSRRRRRQCRGL